MKNFPLTKYSSVFSQSVHPASIAITQAIKGRQGDFWNVDSAGIKFDVTGGVNEVLVNTEKGRKLFVLIRENAVYQPVSKAAGWQPHLEYSTKAPGNQEAFWTEYSAAADLKTKEALLRKYMKGSTLTRIIRKVNPILQKTGLYSIAGKMYKKVFVKK